MKIANLLHNTNLSDNTVLKIKNLKKIQLIKAFKIIFSKLQGDEKLEIINLSFNMHKENINKLVAKYEEVNLEIENLISENDKINDIISL